MMWDATEPSRGQFTFGAANSWRASGTPLLFDGTYAKKPAYNTVRQVLNGWRVA